MPENLRELHRLEDRLSYLYAERCAVEREKSAIALWEEEGVTQVPVASIALLMLGPGTKVSHAAMTVLARNNCLVAWVGEGGVRMYAFGSGGARSAARLIRQAELVSDPASRERIARRLFSMRFGERFYPSGSVERLRGEEGHRVRAEYGQLAERFGTQWEGRSFTRGDPANKALSVAHSCLYGVCHAAILSMGFSPGLGFIHTGKQLSFVYDLADLYKLELGAPVAFRAAAEGAENVERRVRLALRDRFHETRFVARVADDLIRLFEGELPEDIEDQERPVSLTEDDGQEAT